MVKFQGTICGTSFHLFGYISSKDFEILSNSFSTNFSEKNLIEKSQFLFIRLPHLSFNFEKFQ